MKFPKWSIKYIIMAFALLIASTVLMSFGGRTVWVNDMPHYLNLASLLTGALGLLIFTLLVGYLMGADYALKTQQQSNGKAKNQ